MNRVLGAVNTQQGNLAMNRNLYQEMLAVDMDRIQSCIHPRNTVRNCIEGPRNCIHPCAVPYHLAWQATSQISNELNLGIQSPRSRRGVRQPIEPGTPQIPTTAGTPKRLKRVGSEFTDPPQHKSPPPAPPGLGTRTPESAAVRQRGEERRCRAAWVLRTYHGVALAGVEGGLLRAHGERVELRERVGGAPEGPVERPVRLLQARRLRLALLPGHPPSLSPRPSPPNPSGTRPAWSPPGGREPETRGEMAPPAAR